MSNILIVGAGAWGSALAIHCARVGHRVTLWARNPDNVQHGLNPRLPGIPLPEAITVSHSLPPDAELTVLATPVQHLRAALALPLPPAPILLAMKGLELGSRLFPAEILAATRPSDAAILTGPNFAHEIARGLPAAAVVASTDPALRRLVVRLLGARQFRLYESPDPVGAQLGGAAKNVIAIAAGIAVAAGFGENARAALITRGVAELARLAQALGGRPETISGLSGVGDLVLTCAGSASRNYRLGLAIGAGTPPDAARLAIGAAVEGWEAAPALLARAGDTPCPIIAAVAAILAGRLDVSGAMASLLDRPEHGE